MRRIILASHGMLAEGMKDSVTFIVGHSNNIYTISAYTKEDFSTNSRFLVCQISFLVEKQRKT